MDVRAQIVGWAQWAVAHKGQFNYSEGGDRMVFETRGAGVLPVTTDCSGFVTLCYRWADAPDPNGDGYGGLGYTGTLLAHGTEIPLAAVVPGDVIVYGPDTGWHTALIVQGGADPLTVSHGQQGDPSYVRVSQDGRTPQRYLRFPTNAGGIAVTPPAVQTGNPNVKHEQDILVMFGYLPLGSADGVMGPQTKSAIERYQTALKIGADGQWGPQTQAASNAFIASLKPLAPRPAARPVIQQGSSGQAVARLQAKLGIKADGSFGPVTKATVEEFQRVHSLTVDGVVGPATWAALGA